MTSAPIAQWLNDRYLREDDILNVGGVFADTRIEIPVYSPTGAGVFTMLRNFDDNLPKYSYVPEKCRPTYTLYALVTQAHVIRGKGYAIVVEGVADALAAHRLGLPAVSSFSANMGGVQHALLSLLCNRIVVWGDGDEAGNSFCTRAIERFDNVSGVVVEGYDPAAYIALCDGKLPSALKVELLEPSEERALHIFNGDVCE